MRVGYGPTQPDDGTGDRASYPKSFGILSLCLLAWLSSCSGEDTPPRKNGPPAEDPPAALFRGVTEQVGVDFLHTAQLSGEFFLPEIMGSGCAVFDANGDDLPDLYFVSKDWAQIRLPKYYEAAKNNVGPLINTANNNLN